MSLVRRTFGPIQPFGFAHFVLFVLLALAAPVSVLVNQTMDSYFCDPDLIGARGACADLRQYMWWNASAIALAAIIFALSCMIRMRFLIVIVVLTVCAASMFFVLSLWISVYFMEISTYTRGLSGLHEDLGVSFNVILLLGVFVPVVFIVFNSMR